ncbi:hypothetical protein [Streptomyces seoulensis]|uniref:hypothetical protein n=1 Tax=Streptomyces seoulensis TaxID=73044 RepID=UPI001FCC8DE5|nr:hypothetical protein [Streptomyces seoulensis]BDH07209.1 hypothetical protein HEK131_44360 [Streptomyces seoulensis]
MHTDWWQRLWRQHAHITTPLRQHGLECDIELGLSAHYVQVSLSDGSYLIISPPQEPPSRRPPGDPEGWIVTRQHPDNDLFEVIYDSVPSSDPGAPERPEARHGGSATHLIDAIEQRLTQLRLLPVAPTPSRGTPHPAVAYAYAEAAALIHQIADPVHGLLKRLGDFFEAAGEKAKEAEQDDGFDLSYDLADAAVEVRRLVEVLNAAEDHMRVLTSSPPLPRPATARSCLPVPSPAQPRHTR